MNEKVEFLNFEDMKIYIVNLWKDTCFSRSPFDVDDIVIESDSFSDPRIGWHDVRHVCISRFGGQNFALCGAPQCIGWCATIYDK